VEGATGVDACRGGWVAVTLAPGGAPAAAPPRVRVASSLQDLGLTGLTGIDMPLGLLADGWRTVDALARRALGRRGSTVFAIAPRPVWNEQAYADANRRCRQLAGKGLSVQAWGLRPALLQADGYRRGCRHQLYEVHPELAFCALAGSPLAESKHTREGRATRRALLAAAGVELPSVRSIRPGAGGATPAEDDVLDAAAAAWSALRIAAGTAVTITDPRQRADDGTEIAIRY
jgi:predicted RNase H-like nuclease